MPAAKHILAATAEVNKSVCNSFQFHCSTTRVNTHAQCIDLLRKYYPDYHVTEVAQGRVSLFEFADAGKATVTHDAEDESFHATRQWHSVGQGIEKKLHPGKIDDDFRFSRFQYIWEDKEYLVYFIVWKDMLEPQQRIFYVLHPRTGHNVIDGHCTDTDALVMAAGKWTSQLHDEIFVYDNGRWEKSKELYKSVNGSSWSDVILDPDMKSSLIEDVQGFFDNQDVYKQYAVPWKRGIILHGVPGNGKTVSIKALMSSLGAREDNIPSLYVKSLDTNCQTEQTSIRQIFTQARHSAPCLLVFEDLDSLVGDKIRSYFLNEVDGLESNDGILMIGSTNHLSRLDPAIAKRPSRFDRKYHFQLPGERERELYAKYWQGKLQKNEMVGLFPEEVCKIIAKMTEGFSFAYLKELFVMALLSLVRGFKGDEFEMVDEEEAKKDGQGEKNGAVDKADATKETKPDTPQACTCNKTCPTCNLPFETTVKQADEAAEKKKEAKTARMVMPNVDIPEQYVDNLLLKVIKHQIRILHAEMDNTKPEDWVSGKKSMPGGEMSMQMAMMRAQRRRG
jgi:transitional endoplasmic reticulum ATPase